MLEVLEHEPALLLGDGEVLALADRVARRELAPAAHQRPAELAEERTGDNFDEETAGRAIARWEWMMSEFG
jgi:hypothetical protein